MSNSKSRGSIALTPIYVHVNDGCSTEFDAGPRSVRAYTSYERIDSEKPRFKRYGNCYHLKVDASFPSSPITYYCPDDCSGTRPQWVTVSNRQWFSLHELPPQPSIDWAAKNAMAFEVMKPSLSCGFSLSNFIFELRDLKTMFKIWQHARSLTKNIASGYLNYQFGWKLFIKDVVELYDKISNMEETLRGYLSKQGRVMTRHWTEPVETSEIETSTVVGNVECKTNTQRSIELHCTMRFTYTVPAAEQNYSKLKGISDVLGAKLNLATVWEALPFSFVVDWFLGVGDYLQSLSTDYYESKVTVLDYCMSSKVTDIHSHTVDIFNQGANYHIGSETCSYYTRRRMLPNTDGFGIWSTDRYGRKQILLSLALLLA